VVSHNGVPLPSAQLRPLYGLNPGLLPGSSTTELSPSLFMIRSDRVMDPLVQFFKLGLVGFI